MATSYISNKSGTYDATNSKIYGDRWLSQSFTVLDRFTIEQVKIKLARTGSPGVCSVSIREVNRHIPYSAELCSEKFPSADVESGVGGEEMTVTFKQPVTLLPGVIYCIVCSTSGGDSSNFLVWFTTDSDGYTEGKYGLSVDGGTCWSIDTEDGELDLYFEVLGNTPMILLGETFVGKQFSLSLGRTRAWQTDTVSYRSGLEQRNDVWSTPSRRWGLEFRHLQDASRIKLEEYFDRIRGSAREFLFTDEYDYQGSCEFYQESLEITAVSKTDGTFVVDGQHDAEYDDGQVFIISGSTGNDGIYTIDSSASYDVVTDETTITVANNIPNSTVDGSILRLEYKLFNIYHEAKAGYYVEEKCNIVPSEVTVEVDGVGVVEETDYLIDDLRGIIIFLGGSCPANNAVITVVYEFYYRVRSNIDEQTNYNLTDTLWSFDSIGFIEVKGRLTGKKFDVDVIGDSPADWVSPTSYIDPDTDWTDEALAYDEDNSTYAYSSIPAGSPGVGAWLELWLVEQTAINKIRFDVLKDSDIDTCQVELYYDGSWQALYSTNTHANHTWYEVSIGSTKMVSAARITFQNTDAVDPHNAWLYEFEFSAVV